ncbi:hypothetical protein C7N43_15720 [Sphingobacteriales bacterium UPWRP_1]|nr:hypothetical protein BVG80_04365 [Sphingobacteriales bacterium TSM_CSM]PSJ76056.1 hypothetical protein C7N43_15720 [Sphingobacteriales bacterium UPWRP_1]
MIKSRNAYKLDLEKQRLKLKIKEQELEIQKSLMQLKSAFSPVNYAGRMFWESLDDNALLASGQASEEELKAIEKRKRQRAMLLKQISNLFINLLLTLETYLATPTSALKNRSAASQADKEGEEAS